MIKLALIGCGKWGRHYLKTLTTIKGCALKWVCDLDFKKVKEVISDYPQVKYTENIDDILNDSSISGVVIATTPESHFCLAKEFIMKGKSVLVEKPVTIYRQDSIDLINLALAHNTLLMAGYLMLFHPSVQKINKLLDENDLRDQLCYIHMSRTNPFSPVSGVDVLHDLAVHDIYLSRSLMGENPVWVMARGGRYDILILIGFPHGKIASVLASSMHSEKTRKITLVTPDMKIVFDDVQPEGKKIQLFTNGDTGYFLSVEDNIEPLRKECLHFIECIGENKEPESGSEAIAFVTKITDCITHSLRKGGGKIMIDQE